MEIGSGVGETDSGFGARAWGSRLLCGELVLNALPSTRNAALIFHDQGWCGWSLSVFTGLRISLCVPRVAVEGESMGLAGQRVSGGLPGACRVLCGFFAARLNWLQGPGCRLRRH